MKVRFFNTYEPVVPIFRDLAPALARRGADVEIVVSAAPYRSGQSLGDFFREHAGVRVTEAPALGVVPRRPAQKLGVMIGYLARAIPGSLLGRRADLNVFLTQPPLFGIWGQVLRRVRGQRYVCMLMDVYPHLLVALGFLRRDSLRVRLATAAVHRTLRGAEAVVVVGRCMQEVVEGIGVPADRIHVIACWPHDTVVAVDRADNRFRRDQAWRDKFVVMYAGNIGFPQDFDDLFAAAARLAPRQDIEFVFVGGGAREADVKAEAARRKLANASFLPFAHDRYALSQIMSAADVHFVSLRPECAGLAVPSKTYAAFAAARPVIYQGAAHGEIARMLAESGAGAVVAPGDVTALVDAVVGYADDDGRWRAASGVARALTETRYNGRAEAERLADILVAAADGGR